MHVQKCLKLAINLNKKAFDFFFKHLDIHVYLLIQYFINKLKIYLLTNTLPLPAVQRDGVSKGKKHREAQLSPLVDPQGSYLVGRNFN